MSFEISPTAPTRRLISDFFDRGARGPLLGGIEGRGEFDVLDVVAGESFARELGVLVALDTEELLDLRAGGAAEGALLLGRSPAHAGASVELRGVLLGDEGFLNNSRGGREDGDEEESEE